MGWEQGMGPQGKYGGIDISNHQPPSKISMPVVTKNIDFMWHKATEATGFVDRYWAQRSAYCRDNKVPYGAYHFARPDRNGWKAEADHFLNHIDGKETMAPCLDWEHKPGIQALGKQGATNWCLEFMNYVGNRLGVTPWFYTSYYIARDMMTHDPALGKFPLWEAWYATNDNHAANQARVDSGWIPPTPPQWEGISMWQYSSAARNIPGTSGVRIDTNVSYVVPWNADVGSPPAKPPPVVKPPSKPADPSTPILKVGSRGEKVKSLQTLLTGAGHGVAVDGVFGPATEAAVRAYQQAQGLAVDGIVGPDTWAKLLAFLGPKDVPQRGVDYDGYLEKVQTSPGKIRVTGWGVDPKDVEEKPSFRLVIVGGPPNKLFKGNSPRIDARVKKARPEYAKGSGMGFIYTREDVPPGEYTVAVHVKKSDGVWWNLWQSPQKGIKVPAPKEEPPKPVDDVAGLKNLFNELAGQANELIKKINDALERLDKLG